MRILVLGGPMLVASLRNLGEEVFYVGLDCSADWQVSHPYVAEVLCQKVRERGFEPDGFFCVDNGNIPLLLDPQNMPCPSIWFSIDTYCNPWHIPYGYGFDWVYVAQKDSWDLFHEEGLASSWFPLFCQESMALRTKTLEEGGGGRDIPICFVGTLEHPNNPTRAPFLREVKKHVPLLIRQGDYEPLFRRSQMVLNQSAFGEVNFRVFEAMACGALLVTEAVENGLTMLFDCERELLCYPRGAGGEAARILKQALANPEKCAQMARAGLEKVLAQHTSMVRAKEVQQKFRALLEAGTWKNRLQNESAQRGQFVRQTYGIFAAELSGDKWEQYRHFFERLYTQK